MKTIILAGGFGTRFSEKTDVVPKSLIRIGSKPILWHIMNHYAMYDYKEFVVALGFLGEEIKKFFLDYSSVAHDISIDLKKGDRLIYNRSIPDWYIHLVDTGIHTQTGGRIKRLKEWIGNQRFMLTYGDGLSDLDIEDLVSFHKSHGKLATVTAVHAPPRFGGIELEGSEVVKFSEKPQKDWINGGFFVLEPQVLDFIEGDETMWEKAPLENLALSRELMAYTHTGFWHPMDTLRDHKALEHLYQNGSAPWMKKKEKV